LGELERAAKKPCEGEGGKDACGWVGASEATKTAGGKGDAVSGTIRHPMEEAKTAVLIGVVNPDQGGGPKEVIKRSSCKKFAKSIGETLGGVVEKD